MPRWRFTREDRSAIAQRVINGEAVPAVASSVGCSQEAVRAWVAAERGAPVFTREQTEAPYLKDMPRPTERLLTHTGMAKAWLARPVSGPPPVPAVRRARPKAVPWRRAFHHALRLDAIFSGRNPYERFSVPDGDDPTFDEVATRLDEAWEEARAEVWAWNLDHQQPRFRPADETVTWLVPDHGSRPMHRMASRRRPR